MQTGSPYPLVKLAKLRAPAWVEEKLHVYLRKDHVRGEWFRRSRRLDSILKLAEAGDHTQIIRDLVKAGL